MVFLPADAVALTLVAPTNALLGQVPELELGAEGSSLLSHARRARPSLRGVARWPRRRRARRARAAGSEPVSRAAARSARARPGARQAVDGGHQGPPDAGADGRDAAPPGLPLRSRVSSGASDNPLDHFLFVSKRGHCEFYSTAMAVILRSIDVPTRNVTGFIGGTYNRFSGSYAVRQGDAHSWVEAYVDGLGWTRFDPTPPASSAPRSEIHGMFATLRDIVEAMSQRWDHHVVGYDLKQQLGLARTVREHYRALFPEGGWCGAPSISRGVWCSCSPSRAPCSPPSSCCGVAADRAVPTCNRRSASSWLDGSPSFTAPSTRSWRFAGLRGRRERRVHARACSRRPGPSDRRRGPVADRAVSGTFASAVRPSATGIGRSFRNACGRCSGRMRRQRRREFGVGWRPIATPKKFSWRSWPLLAPVAVKKTSRDVGSRL